MVSLTTGDPAPWFTLPSTSNPTYHIDTVGGYRAVLFFFGSSKQPHVAAVLNQFLQQQPRFAELEVPFFGVSLDPEDTALARAIASPTYCKFLWDFQGEVSRLYQVLESQGDEVVYRPTTFVLDETLHVLRVMPLDRPEQHVAELLQFLSGLPAAEPEQMAVRQAPVLLVPRVFEPEFCQQLIELFEQDGGEDSGFMRERDGKTVEVLDYDFKKRRDFNLTDADPALLKRVNELVLRRIKPEIEKTFQFSISRFERHVVACYESENQGYFNRHRDNTTKGTAHRRFAMTINLNRGYEGGCLWFPEYGRRLYRPQVGEAIVFSCSLLHEVTPVTSSRRYALLSFFYDEEAAKIREQNQKYLVQPAAPEAVTAEPPAALAIAMAQPPAAPASEPAGESTTPSKPAKAAKVATGFQAKPEKKKALKPTAKAKPLRVLFLHPNFPAQFRHLATALAKDPSCEVVFGTAAEGRSLPGVRKLVYAPSREVRPETHHYVRSLEGAVLHGQAMYRMAQTLQTEGFIPDVVYGHSGWGPTLFMKDLFPTAKLLCYFEWFYHAHGSDCDFDPSMPMDLDNVLRTRVRNAPILLDLYSCNQGLCPTHWQRQQFPPEFHPKLKVLHDGIDTDFFRPQANAKLVLPSLDLDLSHVDEIVTYATRGMEPYRGFPQFMQAAALIQQRRPNCHIVVVGDDRVAYGRELPDGKTYKQLMLEQLSFDRSRLHFTGSLPYNQYLQVLQASSVHVYLSYPFVLSWSMLEALATGCLVVGSSTAPIMEVVRDRENGLLVDFFTPEAIADRVDEVLAHPDRMAAIRANARQTILDHYDLARRLPEHLDWLKQGLV